MLSTTLPRTFVAALIAWTLPATAIAESAAEIDFVRTRDMTPEQAATVPWFCEGRYIQPAGYAGAASPAPDAPADISAQQAEIQNGVSTTLTGDVRVDQRTREILGDVVSIDEITQEFFVTGPAQIREPGVLITGDAVTGNLLDGTGTVDDATFLLHDFRLRGSARQLDKLADDRVVLHRGRLTGCDPGQDVWEIRGRTIRLNPDTGWGTARDLTLNVKKVPVAWFPYLRFPIDDERHTGFLLPSIGYDSRGGTDFVLPFYWNIAPNYDLTYTPHSMWKRGLIHEAEGRLLTRHTENLISGALLKDDKIYDARREVDLTPGAELPPFEAQDRWMTHASHAGQWGKFVTSGRFSRVSDIDYLNDIGGSFDSAAHDQAANGIQENIGDQTRVPALRSWAEGKWRDGPFSSYLLVEDFQPMDAQGREQYTRLPEFSFAYGDSFSLFETRAEYRYTFFDLDNEDFSGAAATYGERTLVDATVDLPLYRQWGYLTPSVRVLHRQYNLRDNLAGNRDDPAITTPAFSLDSGLYFDRFFNLGALDLQQTLEPRLYYLHVEYDDQSDLPSFDTVNPTPGFDSLFRTNRYTGSDRFGDTNQLSAGITTRFLSGETGYEYLSARVGQVYYFKDRQVVFQPQPNEDPTRTYSPLFSELRFNLGNELALFTTLEFDPKTGDVNRTKANISYLPDTRRIINLGYSYTNPEAQRLVFPDGSSNSEESDISVIWPLWRKWSVFGRWNFGWDANQTIESLAGIEYNDCCWKARLAVRRFLIEPLFVDVTLPDGSMETLVQPRAESRILFEIQFKGLGNLNDRLDRLLEFAIPGYRQREERIGN